MKRPLQLSLAIALALGGTNALALGLGPVHVKSKLNQPLDAEIPIIQGNAGEAEGLLVNLAAAEDFERVGINRSHLNVPIEFTLGKSANGEPVIKVTSKEPIHDTYLDFLVEANWPKGRLLREYTVLLDPPVMAPARGAATTSAVAAAPAPVTIKRREAPAATASTEAPKPAAAPPRPKPAPAPAPTPAVQAPEHKVVAGQYGPVAEGETLSGVARATRVSGVNADQMMLALLKSNPNAFYKDNVNALKRGAILRVPSADEVKALGSATEAAAQIRSQVEDWRGGRASPTRVADAGSNTPATPVAAAPKAPKATASNGKATGDEHLALVPPKAGKDSMAMADRPGSGAGSAATSELKSELARTKETLTTREQETGDLKSRVKELEGLKDKNDRLIGLKDSEIAELQQKLKQLQDKSTATTAKPASTTTPLPTSTPAPATTTPATTTPATALTAPPPKASTTPATTPSTTATAKIDKQDIWGDSGNAPATAKTDAGKTSTPTATSSTPAASPIASTTTTPSTTTPSSTTSTPTTPPTSSTTPTPSAVSTTMPLEPTPATTTTPSSPSTPAPVAATATPKPTPNATTGVKPPSAPHVEWYEASWVKPAALGAGVLLLLGGILGLRKRKVVPALAGRGSVADSFGDSPLTGADGADAGTIEAEEASLREQLQLDPSNVGLHLELLSLYYAERDVERFEDAAADMHAYVEDAHQPEWLEAQAMGQELAPHNPLFSGFAHFDGTDAAIASAQADTIERPHLHDHQDFDTAPSRLDPPAALHADEDLGFNLGRDDFAATPMPAASSVAKHDDSFDFTLPPLDLDAPMTHLPPAAAVAPKAADLDDDYFPGEDAIGTKLDLAKAYMDMGDPEGARSMLEEVVAEGSDAQKAEAHRLIAEIR